MRKKMKSGVLLAVVCMFLMGMTTSATTQYFLFTIEPNYYDPHSWTGTKDDNEQKAYITTLNTTGSGSICAAVYDQYGSSQLSIDVPIAAGSSGTVTSNYLVTVSAGTTCRLIGGDPEGTVTSDSFTVYGRWTP